MFSWGLTGLVTEGASVKGPEPAGWSCSRATDDAVVSFVTVQVDSPLISVHLVW